MKKFCLTLLVALFGLGLGMATTEVDARRLGGGGSAGMKRQLPPRQSPNPPPQQQQQATQNQPAATPGAPAAGAAAQTAPRRSWLGPVAGLAAGLGLAALMSHLGLGEGFATFLTFLLLALLAVLAIRFVMRRLAGARLQPAGGPALRTGSEQPWGRPAAGLSPAAVQAAATGTPAAPRHNLPPGFDAASFSRVAKLMFLRLQTANDAGNLEDLRRFTTPEMFATARLDLHDRQGAPQRTDVVQLDAEVLDLASEGDQDVVSVRYHGLMREENDSVALPFDEVWHLVRPRNGTRDWAIAGIQQTQ
ncbi:Tim44-like domain-containing protein [Aquabacterium sp. A7-Y]|uniref:Tim44 domain-containing protein n=1 Tax=Aquabacterium sp. A7-Y TaxID=1349605 RepID=UPI00223E362B|nr:Tim44-like domain-containing protein [Aquabacterium sp. A7-Y]MCW7539415.1 Tim44-like domain-containing protein [Aquabacterium sp. A7-Y]